MARSKNNRIVHEPPMFTDFKPRGFKKNDLPQIELSIDEFEAVRLADFKSQSHEEAAQMMNISRPTFSRLIETARHKIADFIINGKYLEIKGGAIHFKNNLFRCQSCEQTFSVEIEKIISRCPHCESNSIVNIAGSMGHGKCCTV
ncbi:MAG: DUF134 domain-containing protein [Bacteroidales bacterium]|nr:DUF134 domain-containing protein [Bacteroidales bacterium]